MSNRLGLGCEVEVRITIPLDFGRLSGRTENEGEIIQKVPVSRPRNTVKIHQQFRVSDRARIYAHFNITFELYLESPGQDLTNPDAGMVLVEQRAIRLQVSNTYTFNPEADFLLISSSTTREQQSGAIQHFIRNRVNMDIDIFNAEHLP